MSIVVNCTTPAFNYMGAYRVYRSKRHVRCDFPLDNIETLAHGKAESWLAERHPSWGSSQPTRKRRLGDVTMTSHGDMLDDLIYYPGRYVSWAIYWAGTPGYCNGLWHHRSVCDVMTFVGIQFFYQFCLKECHISHEYANNAQGIYFRLYLYPSSL